jgi:hypothetical protein
MINIVTSNTITNIPRTANRLDSTLIDSEPYVIQDGKRKKIKYAYQQLDSGGTIYKYKPVFIKQLGKWGFKEVDR